MAGITFAATLNTPMSELRPASTDRILVIEHDRALRKILQRLFSSEGYEVEVVPGGVAGLEMLRQRPPSVVVLDLPYDESSGSDLCRKIAQLIPGLPLVILSASSDVAHRLLLEMGATDHVSIPFSPRELADRLRVLMRRKSGKSVTAIQTEVALAKDLQPAPRSTARRETGSSEFPGRGDV
jgi:DNA-binding response OmpR family regulator